MAQAPRQNESEVRQFFAQWEIYQTLMERNYFSHREVGQILHEKLGGLAPGFSLMDLGAGDAAFSSRFLTGLPLGSYEAVDLSEPALEGARVHCRVLPCSRRFTLGSFVEEIPRRPAATDVIYIGLSLHHLPRAQKEEFFPFLARALKPGGRLYVYEPVLRPGEIREDCLQRWWKMAQAEWTALDEARLRMAWDHVSSADYPEESATWKNLGQQAGFSSQEILYTEPRGFYSLLEFTLSGDR
jgi:ubiquinone/menaquinone biosynthesis C-methylase UbiE